MEYKQDIKSSAQLKDKTTDQIIKHETKQVPNTKIENNYSSIHNKAIGGTWDEYEKELFTPEEIEESNKRVSLLLAEIDRRNPTKN